MPEEQQTQTAPTTKEGETAAAKAAETTTTTTTEANNSEGVKAGEALSADINKLLEKARTDEKNKQYGKIQKLEADRDASKGLISQLQEQITELTKSLNKEPKGKKTEEGETTPATGLTSEQLDKAIAAAASTTLERAEKEIFGPRIAKLEAELKAAEERDANRDLSDYRNRLITENKDAIIPELVTGTTREEIDASLISAKQVFARTAETLSQRQTAAKAGADGKLPPVPSVNSGAATAAETDVSRMSAKEYAENRQRLLADASKAAKAALGG